VYDLYMLHFQMPLSILVVVISIFPTLALQSLPETASKKQILLDVIRQSSDIEREETLVYLRVYTDGLAEAHPMRKVDFRNLEMKRKQLPKAEFEVLSRLLSEPATSQLLPAYSRFWGNKDFGSKLQITISNRTQQKLELINFQPFLARKTGQPYPQQVEKVGCEIWKLRYEVSEERLEKDWLKGCSQLGY